MKNYYTDMASEITPKANKPYKVGKNVLRLDQVLDRDTAEIIGKSAGKYSTLDILSECNDVEAGRAIKKVLHDMAGEATSTLVVGLGNENMIADSLGAKTASRIIVSRHMYKEMSAGYGASEVSCFCPSVLGVTGLASFDLILSAVDIAKPSLVLCVDSLASSRIERLGTSIQVTDTGIAPGSGLGLRHNKIDSTTMGVPVIALGVPLVMFARTLIKNCFEEIEVSPNVNSIYSKVGDMVFTPKEIDIHVTRCARIISLGLNMFLHSKMSEADINCLSN